MVINQQEAYLLNYVRDWFPQLQHPQVQAADGRGPGLHGPQLKPADQAMDSSRVVRTRTRGGNPGLRPHGEQ